MAQTMKYRLEGTRIRVGSGLLYALEHFETIVLAEGYDDAQKIARYNWRTDWREIKFTRVTQLG